MSIKLPAVGNSQILSVGSYRPKRLVPNSEIVDRIESSDEWIVQRTGIQSRRFAGPEESVISMAAAACEMALERAHMSMADIDTVILATISYPFQAPSAATELVALLGNPKAAAVDIWFVREILRMYWLLVLKNSQISPTQMIVPPRLYLPMAQGR